MESVTSRVAGVEKLQEHAELHAQLQRAQLGRARAERERDSHALLAESLLQEMPAVAGKKELRHHHRHCRGCRRMLPA